MNWNDMVYNEVLKGCTKAGCDSTIAKNAAISALKMYKNNQFTKPTKLITEAITEAKKLIVKKRK